MEKKNESAFILVPFTTHPGIEGAIFTFFLLILLIYLFTVAGNLCLLIEVYTDCHPHTPLYCFLRNMAFLDICYNSVSVPKVLDILLTGHKAITFAGCITQLYFYASFAATEFLLFSVMSYDCYVAICKPLHYMVHLRRSLCFLLSLDSWAIGLLISLPVAIFTSRLSCGSHEVNHLLCDVKPLLGLSCTNSQAVEISMYVEALLCAFCSFLLIHSSYVCIISNILKVSSAVGRNRAFSTCSSHLVVLSLVCMALLSPYLKPSSTYSPDHDKLVTLIYSAIIPMMNPIIYSLRNKEVKCAFMRICNKYLFLPKIAVLRTGENFPGI